MSGNVAMTTEALNVSARTLRRLTLPLVAAAMLAGCATRDHVVVGAVPDDYRTNHPIVIGEKEETIDIAVAQDGYRMTRSQRDAVDGFLYRYDKGAATPVTILAPNGSANAAAASSVAADMASFIRKTGVRNVQINHYSVGSGDVSAPIRVSYFAVRASTGKCGRWPEDLMQNSENKHYANFGCSYQNNLAAQVANPNDLVGPRRPGEIDAEKRGTAIGDYQEQVSDWSPESDYQW